MLPYISVGLSWRGDVCAAQHLHLWLSLGVYLYYGVSIIFTRVSVTFHTISFRSTCVALRSVYSLNQTRKTKLKCMIPGKNHCFKESTRHDVLMSRCYLTTFFILPSVHVSGWYRRVYNVKTEKEKKTMWCWWLWTCSILVKYITTT